MANMLSLIAIFRHGKIEFNYNLEDLKILATKMNVSFPIVS